MNEKQRHIVLRLPKASEAEFWLQRRGDQVESHNRAKTPNGSQSGGAGGGWLKCHIPDCLGECMDGLQTCLAHTPRDKRILLMDQMSRLGALRVFGCSVSDALMEDIRTVLQTRANQIFIYFLGAEIISQLKFESVDLPRRFAAHGTEFFKHTEFLKCTFNEGAAFTYCSFDHAPVSIIDCSFKGALTFNYCRARGASIAAEGCTFEKELRVDGAGSWPDNPESKCTSLSFSRSTFNGIFSARASSLAVLQMQDCVVNSGGEISDTDCNGIIASGISVKGDLVISSGLLGGCDFTHSRLEGRIYLDASCKELDFTGSVLLAGGSIKSGGNIKMERLEIGGSLRVSGQNAIDEYIRISSLINSDVSKLTIANADMTRCKFYEAHGLTGLVLDSGVRFSRCSFLTGDRDFLAEEYAWRASTSSGHPLAKLLLRGFLLDGIHVGLEPPASLKGQPRLDHFEPRSASEMIATYRALRFGLESRSDIPRATDFYLGEMEMRRLSEATKVGERFLLTAYCVLSGYGARPLRTLLWWMLLVAIGVYTLTQWGGYELNTQTTVEIIRLAIPGIPGTDLLQSDLGRWTTLALRIIGSLLVALLILAVRSTLMRKPGE